MLLYGASGHAKVVIDCLESSNIVIDGIFDDDINKTNLLEYVVLGSYVPDFLIDKEIIIAIGDNKIRKKIAEAIKHKFGKAIHPTATIQKNVSIGEGSTIFHHAIIQSGTKVENHVILNTNASIDHDCVIGSFAHIAPKATLCGGVRIGEGTLVGAGAVIIPNINIGKWVTIGAGTVVINDIPDYALVLGNPGKIKR